MVAVPLAYGSAEHVDADQISKTPLWEPVLVLTSLVSSVLCCSVLLHHCQLPYGSNRVQFEEYRSMLLLLLAGRSPCVR
jgi:hypothetical protein